MMVLLTINSVVVIVYLKRCCMFVPNIKTNKMKEIKTLYGKLKDKKAFCTELSKEVEATPLSLYNHWFGSFWSIPEKYQEIVLTKLKEKML